MYNVLARTVSLWNLNITMETLTSHQAKTAGKHKHTDHTDLWLVAHKQIIFHRVWYVTDEELQGATLRNPGKPSARPGGRATRLVLPALHPTTLRIYGCILKYILHSENLFGTNLQMKKKTLFGSPVPFWPTQLHKRSDPEPWRNIPTPPVCTDALSCGCGSDTHRSPWSSYDRNNFIWHI